MKILITYLLVFITNQILQYLNITSNFTNNYLDDILFFPIALSVNLIYQTRTQKNYKLPFTHAILGLVFISVLFEIIIPKLDTRFTQDVYDVLAYFLGIVIYYIVIYGKRFL